MPGDLIPGYLSPQTGVSRMAPGQKRRHLLTPPITMPASAGATQFTQVQKNSSQRSGSSAAAVNLAFGQATKANNLIVVVVSWFGNATITVTDDASGGSNSYTNVTQAAQAGGAQGHCAIFFTVGKAATTITATPSAAAFISMAIIEESFAGHSNFVVDQKSNTGVGSSTSPSTGTITTTANHELIVIGLDIGGQSTPTETTTGFHSVCNLAGTATEEGISVDTFGDQESANAANYTGTWTLSVSVNWEAPIASFKAA